MQFMFVYLIPAVDKTLDPVADQTFYLKKTHLK